MSWSIRNYNTFVREARAEHGLSLSEARSMYTAMKEHMGRSLYGVDVARHPLISARIAAEVAAPPKQDFNSLSDYLDWYEEADDYDYDYGEMDGTVEY